jgi:hypothetical protein
MSANQFLQQRQDFDRQSVDVLFLNYQAPPRLKHAEELLSRNSLISKVMQRVNHQNSLEARIRERKDLYTGLNRQELTLHLSLSQHRPGKVTYYNFTNQRSQKGGHSAGTTASIQHSPIRWQLQ